MKCKGGRARRILIMDDDPAVLEAAALLLEQRGLQVATYRDSFNRLNAVRRVKPDLVLMDVNMPLVPEDAIVKLMSQDPELCRVPVLLFSSNDERALREALQKGGAAGYVSKSQMGSRFASEIERWLQLFSLGESPAQEPL